MVLQNLGMPRQDLGVVILRRGNVRHGIRHLSEHGRQTLLLGAHLAEQGQGEVFGFIGHRPSPSFFGGTIPPSAVNVTPAALA